MTDEIISRVINVKKKNLGTKYGAFWNTSIHKIL